MKPLELMALAIRLKSNKFFGGYGSVATSQEQAQAALDALIECAEKDVDTDKPFAAYAWKWLQQIRDSK